jgi:hypothetical protein
MTPPAQEVLTTFIIPESPEAAEDPMLEPKRFDRIACGLAMTVALLMGSTFATWAQGPRSEARTNPPAAPSGNAVSTVLTLVVLAALVIAIVVVAQIRGPEPEAGRRSSDPPVAAYRRYFPRSPLHGLVITPTARVPRWRASPVTIEVAGEVPTPELRETVMGIVRAEARKLRPDVITVHHLFIVPPMHRAS